MPVLSVLLSEVLAVDEVPNKSSQRCMLYAEEILAKMLQSMVGFGWTARLRRRVIVRSLLASTLWPSRLRRNIASPVEPTPRAALA